MLVMVCKSATTKPTINPVMSMGAESKRTRMMPCVRTERTKLWVMPPSLEAPHQGLDQQVPAVRQREDHHLERGREHLRLQLLHAERHEHVGDHQVDHDERQVDDEADLEAR